MIFPSHTACSYMYIADFVSRPSDPPGYEDRDTHNCGMVECHVACNMKTILPQNFRERELSQASFEDETCCELKNLISSEWLANVSELYSVLKRLYQGQPVPNHPSPP